MPNKAINKAINLTDFNFNLICLLERFVAQLKTSR